MTWERLNGVADIEAIAPGELNGGANACRSPAHWFLACRSLDDRV